ncbi:hypothetical protein NDU88_006283 [Pleurodeles waltl]|uniref:Uncharacterized protein n=1 Tax=Pleurodeles waltl TaxID=8319 RepID=A0AAV7RL59_PLEWA|nr:hypothetical protein NDU88_006283 [Pleurodeles waltl]
MATGAGRFRIAPPHKGQSMFILGCPGCRKSRRRYPGGSRAAVTGTPIVRSPGGVPKADSPRAAPGGPSSPRLLSACSLAARGHQAPPPVQEVDSSPVGVHTSRSSLCPPLQGGPASASGAGRSAPPNPGLRTQSGGDFVGPGPRRDAQVRRRPPPGSQSRPSGPTRTIRSPSLLRNREPHSPERPGPARREGRGLSVVPGSPSNSGARSRSETTPPQSPPSAAVVPLLTGCKTARFSASRLQFKVGPSGAEQLSVRHARFVATPPRLGTATASAAVGIKRGSRGPQLQQSGDFGGGKQRGLRGCDSKWPQDRNGKRGGGGQGGLEALDASKKQETSVAAGTGASGAATASGGAKQRDLRGRNGKLQEQRRGSKKASGSAAARVPKEGWVRKAIPRGPRVRDGDVVNPIPYSYV